MQMMQQKLRTATKGLVQVLTGYFGVYFSSLSNISVNCQWSEWSHGPCSTSCGAGTLTKTRTITMTGANGGIACNANDATEDENCNEGPCPGIDRIRSC